MINGEKPRNFPENIPGNFPKYPKNCPTINKSISNSNIFGLNMVIMVNN